MTIGRNHKLTPHLFTNTKLHTPTSRYVMHENKLLRVFVLYAFLISHALFASTKVCQAKNLTSRCSCRYFRAFSWEENRWNRRLDDECLNFLSELDVNSVTLLIKFLSSFLLGFIEAKLRSFFSLERIYILNFFSLYDSPNPKRWN